MSSRGERTLSKAVAGGLGQERWHLVEQVAPHSHTDKPKGTTREPDRLHSPGLQCGKIKTQILWLKKSVGVLAVGETPSFTGEFTGETHRVLECTQATSLGNKHQEGPVCSWVLKEVTESRPRAKQAALFPLNPHATYRATTQWRGLPHHGKYLRLCPLLCNRCTKTKKYGPNERTDQNSRKNTTKWQRDS